MCECISYDDCSVCSMVWYGFKVVFLDHYFLDSLKAQKEFKFQQLRQRKMTVAEYVKKFEDIATCTN